jgi:LPS export ABC transporter protein LptC
MINIKKVFFGFFVLWGLSSCTELDTNIYRRKRAQDLIVTREFAEKVTIEYTDSGFLKARIFSPILVAVKQTNNPYVEMKKGLKVDFYSVKGDIQSYLTADYAISYPNKKVIVVQRDVEILNIKGEVLNTEELRWDQVKGRIYTNKPVKITTKDQIITGIGLESNQSFSYWEILNVVASINVPYDKIPRPRPIVPGRGRY